MEHNYENCRNYTCRTKCRQDGFKLAKEEIKKEIEKLGREAKWERDHGKGILIKEPYAPYEKMLNFLDRLSWRDKAIEKIENMIKGDETKEKQKALDTIKNMNFCGLCTTGDCDNCERLKAKKIAMAAVEKDIKAKFEHAPTRQAPGQLFVSWKCRCPRCGFVWMTFGPQKRCHECGQALEWSETWEK